MKEFSWREMWQPQMLPWEVALRAALVYLFVFAMLRLAGRKELSRYSSFDVAVLFLLSITVRRAVISEDPSLTTAFVALATIILMDRLFSYAVFRSSAVARALEGAPILLVQGGKPLSDGLRRANLSYDELISRLRAHGTEALEEVERAFLEADGKVNFVFRHRPLSGL